ncbi:MAG: carboxypeptidase-like regulatory domain-containing protein, partial [Pseudomonadota bacterium]
DQTEGTILRGTVTTGGRPEAWAWITAFSYGRGTLSTERVSVRADAYGRYELPPLRPGKVRLDVTAPGVRSAWRTYVDLPDDYDLLWDLEMPETWVEGRVVAALGGEAIAGAFVRLYVEDRAGQPERVTAEAVSDADGWFRLERVPSGIHDLLVVRDGYGASAVQRIEIVDREPEAGLRIALPEAVRVRVRVTDIAGTAAAGGWLQASHVPKDETGLRVRAHSSSTGVAVLDGLSPGRWALRVGAPGLGGVDLGEVVLLHGEEDLGEVQLESESAIRVSVFVVVEPPFCLIDVNVAKSESSFLLLHRKDRLNATRVCPYHPPSFMPMKCR